MVDVAAVAGAAVVNRLDAVAVRVEQEPAVIVGTVLRPRTGLAVAAVAGVDAGLPERVDVHSRRRDEADVQAPTHRVGRVRLREREIRAPHRVPLVSS